MRRVGNIIVNLDIQPLLNGRDRVAANTMGGNTVFTKTYGMSDACEVKPFREAMRTAMIWQGKITRQSKITMLKDYKELRGNCVLKKAVKPPKDQFEFQANCKQPTLKQILKRPARHYSSTPAHTSETAR